MIALGGSSESLKNALEEYNTAWKAFLVIHHVEMLEQLAVRNTLSWKVASKHDLYAILESLKGDVEQIHIGTVDGRLIASATLNESYDGMSILKILERRSGSDDTLGLDHIDYLVNDTDEVYRLLKESGAHIVQENNEVHNWLSLRFGKNLEFEAKFVDHLVLNVAIKELGLAEERLLKVYQPLIHRAA